LEAVKGKIICCWTINEKKQVEEVNLGTKDQPKIVKFGKQMDKEFKQKLKELLQEYQDTFAWSYKDFKGLPAHICEHRIELEPNARPIKQAKYQMNPAYAAKVKEEIDKLLKT
jgi:hypothetical protein